MTDTRDYFISFTSDDTAVATAINTALRDAGFSTWFHLTDKPLSAGIADWMEVALDASTQMIAICSDAYFDREKGYSRAERQSMFWADPTNNDPLLILVKVANCTFPRVIAQNEYISVTGKAAPEAAAHVVERLRGEQARKALEAARAKRGNRAHPAIFNVPGTLNPLFTGRNAEITRLHTRMKSAGATAITAVHGMGGIGKTTLAREYAHRFGTADRFGGVWWVEAESEGGILAAYDRLADKTGVQKHADQRETAAAMRDWLGAQPDATPWLVIFDNAPNAEGVAEWLPKGSAKVLITSRYQEFGGIAEPLSLDEWDDETTTHFLLDRAGRGTEEEARALATKLGGLPLAAEQAGAYLAQRTTLSFADYGARLVQLLNTPQPNLPGGYPLPLYAAFTAAIEAVAERPEGDAALAILNICSFLSPDGVELQLLTDCAKQTEIVPDPPRAVLADPVRCGDAINALTAYALMRTGKDSDWGDTLHMHRLLSEIARTRLTDDEHKHWSGAAVRMIDGLMPFNSYDDTSAWPLCARLTPHATALMPLDLGAGEEGKALDRLLNQAAVSRTARGDTEGAIALLRRSVEIMASTQKDKPLIFATALSNLANRLSQREATWEEAATCYRRALEIKERELSADDPSLAITLSNFGGLYWRKKDFAEAARLRERALEIFKAAQGENAAEYAVALSNLGTVYSGWANATDDPALREKERDFLIRAATVTRAARGIRHPDMAVRLNNLAAMHANAGDMAQAATDMAQCVAIFLSLDQLAHPQTQQCIEALIDYWTQSGQSEKAERLKNEDLSDLIPIVEQIEAEHRAWVAEDPNNRHFGLPSPVTGARE